MESSNDELTVNHYENGVLVVKELDKSVLSKGAWTTIMFRYQNWENQKNDYGAYRYTIRRYQKRNGQYQLRSKFNISSPDQAKKIIDVLQNWLKTDA